MLLFALSLEKLASRFCVCFLYVCVSVHAKACVSVCAKALFARWCLFLLGGAAFFRGKGNCPILFLGGGSCSFARASHEGFRPPKTDKPFYFVKDVLTHFARRGGCGELHGYVPWGLASKDHIFLWDPGAPSKSHYVGQDRVVRETGVVCLGRGGGGGKEQIYRKMRFTTQCYTATHSPKKRLCSYQMELYLRSAVECVLSSNILVT